METGGEDLGQSVHTGSDITFEYTCTRCEETDGRSREASYYCPECDVYYCKACIQYGCDHGILGKAKMDKWGIPGEECGEHPGNLIELYCGEDELVGCHVCVKVHHRSCKQITSISNVAAADDNAKSQREILHELRELQSRVDKLQKDRSSSQVTLEKSSADKMKHIKDVRVRIDCLLDESEERSVQEINKIKDKVSEQLCADAYTCERLGIEMAKIENKVRKENVDESLKFILLSLGKKCIEKGKIILSELENTPVNDRLSADLHSEIETILEMIESEKNVSIDNDSGDKQYAGQDITEPGIQVRSQPAVKQTAIDSPYKVRHKTVFNVRTKEDSKGCEIFGICQISDGTFVLSDNKNKCLKLVDRTYRVTDRFDLPSDPYNVCCIGYDEVAVALGNKSIQCVSFCTVMAKTRTIRLDHECRGLAYHSDKLFITNLGTTVYVYSISGSLLRTYDNNNLSYPFLSITSFYKRVAVSPNGKLVYITNPSRSMLVTLGITGDLLNTFSPTDAGILRDVCVDGESNVFYCDSGSNRLIQVAANGGKKIANILLPSDKVYKPFVMCFDRLEPRLFVACEYTAEVYVLHLEQK